MKYTWIGHSLFPNTSAGDQAAALVAELRNIGGECAGGRRTGLRDGGRQSVGVMSLRPRQVDFDTTWGGIRETLSGVITLGAVPRDVWNDRFADVYALCVAYPEPQAARLYTEIKAFLRDHAWFVYNKGSHYLDKLFIYLNIQHLKKKKVTLSDLIYGGYEADGDSAILEIRELSLSLWRRHMIEPFQDALVHQLLERINTYRKGGLPDGEHGVIRDVIQSLVDAEGYKKANELELYETVFEKAYLRASGEYFGRTASQLLLECDVYGYMARVLQVIADEQLRCISYLNSSSHGRALAELRARLVEDHLELILAEVPTMVREERRDDLRHLYELLRPLQRPEPLQQLVRQLEEHVRTVGVQRLMSARGTDSPAAFVDTVLHVHSKYSGLVSEVFRDDQLFTAALCRACSAVVNHRGAGDRHCAAPELLVRYCDSLLKKSTKGVTESSLEERLATIVTIFKFVEDKDAFQKHYQKFLCKRLMYDNTVSLDSEEVMVTKFKQTCGYDFTNKLSQMLRDVNVSQEHTQRFCAFLTERGVTLNHNLAIKVIQSGAWPIPITSIVEFRVPQQLEQSITNFEEFYKGKFSGRKLSWFHHLSHAELRLGYLPRMYLVTLHTFAMAVLVLFETADSLSVDEIQLTTGLPDDHLARNVQALVDAKLLTCDRSPASEPGAVLTLNTEFSSRRTRFRVQTAPAPREAQTEVEQTQREVDEGRKMCLQAAIVRIMKARKRLRHNELVQEALGQTRSLFTPQIPMIKKCIDVLIDKEYLARVADAPDEYSYVA
ncbi:Cullin-2 [Amphibalanus amphitrite]|uniref:Cullin-5 n=1 Tax=Amphibalanus amphitrite TaxID=1232801 RepID=A0A6A4VB24_AMPAM|nr:Cullin-2 [Amphibalanus amphitrite]